MQVTDLLMCLAIGISSLGHRDMQVVAVAACAGNFGEVDMLPVTLCPPTVHLCDRVATASELCTVLACVRRIGGSTLDVALSIRRVIRANFASCVGILAGERRPASVSAVDRPAVRKSNEPMRLIDVTTYVPARLADDDRKRKGDGSPGTAVITKTRPQTKRPNLYRVLLLNDDYTPMEFVVHVLERFFNKDHETAHRIMMHVHQHGIGECGVYTYEVAETKVTQVMDFARKHQHPLQCIMEKK
jgi:ATP-dependent Clp protease adaptor protein ClpS